MPLQIKDRSKVILAFGISPIIGSFFAVFIFMSVGLVMHIPHSLNDVREAVGLFVFMGAFASFFSYVGLLGAIPAYFLFKKQGWYHPLDFALGGAFIGGLLTFLYFTLDASLRIRDIDLSLLIPSAVGFCSALVFWFIGIRNNIELDTNEKTK